VAICTDDDALATTARRLRDLGRDGDGLHVLPGYNERLDGLQAALLGVKLPHIDAWTAQRRTAAAAYQERLGEHLELVSERSETPCTYHLFPVRASDREELAAHLARQGVSSGVHYPVAVPDQPALGGRAEAADVPIARDWAARELSIPIFPGMTEEEIEHVSAAVISWSTARPAGRTAP
jgi:dTDP-4-amino-4,6-dideoxygalactose transaminase